MAPAAHAGPRARDRRGRVTVYPFHAMNETTGRSFGRTVLAALVLLVAGWILLKIAVGIVSALFIPIVVIGVIIAAVWAYRVLF